MALADAKELMGEAVPLLFEPRKEGKMLITSLAERGIGGYLTILFLFSIPLAIMVYPKLAARKRSHGDHRQE